MRRPVAPHIAVDERGIAYIEGTETKVLSVILNKRMSRDTPEQLRANMPHLSLVQVYAAIAYYLDHQAEVDGHIKLMDEMAGAILAEQPKGLTREELLARRARLSKPKVVA